MSPSRCAKNDDRKSYHSGTSHDFTALSTSFPIFARRLRSRAVSRSLSTVSLEWCPSRGPVFRHSFGRFSPFVRPIYRSSYFENAAGRVPPARGSRLISPGPASPSHWGYILSRIHRRSVRREFKPAAFYCLSGSSVASFKGALIMNIENIWHYDLRQGSTDHPRNGACLLDAGMWLVYGVTGDNPPCSCPVTRSYGICLNDGMSDIDRQLLKPFILRVVGNRDPASEAARLRFIILETARRVVPLAFDFHFPKCAAQLRALNESSTYKEINNVAVSAASVISTASNLTAYLYCAAANAAAAAANAAAAAVAANAAAAAANAAAAAVAANAAAANYAANAANYAANAANYAANAARAVEAAKGDAQKVWKEAIWILDNVLRIGKQSPEFEELTVREAVRQFELARGEVLLRG